jgi:phosphate transport system permease protein
MSATTTLDDMRRKRHGARKRVNAIALTLSLAAMAFGLVWLIWILVETVRLGVGGLALATFTEMTPPPMEEGGLANAIVGSLMMVTLATLIGTPVGVMAGIYLAEYGQRTWLGSVRALSTTSCCRHRPSWWVCLSTTPWWPK